MRDHLRISEVSFTRKPERVRDDGLVGFVKFELASLLVDSVAVRRSARGGIVLTFPERVDRSGVSHPFVRPLDQVAREAITTQVVNALRRQGVRL